MRRFRVLALALALFASVSLVRPAPAYALHKNIQRILIFGGWGLGFGTVAGLITVPLSQNWRTLFIGSSVGMYLGAAVGIYYILAFNDPDNPLRAKPGEPHSEFAPSERTLPPGPTLGGHPALVWVQVPVLSF